MSPNLSKTVDLHISGTITDSEAIDRVVQALNEPFKKEPWYKRLWAWFWSFSWKFKLATVVIIGMLIYASILAYRAGTIQGARQAYQPVIHIFMGVLTPILDILKAPDTVVKNEL
jgi:hypothetical protein